MDPLPLLKPLYIECSLHNISQPKRAFWENKSFGRWGSLGKGDAIERYNSASKLDK